MTERNVTVKLRMTVRDYIGGATEAERMTGRLAAAQRQMADDARRAGDELDRTAQRAERAGRRTQRGMLYAAAGVAALGVAGGGLKVLPGLLTASVTAGAALPPMLLGAAQTGGVLAVALKGVGKAMGEVIKSDDPFAGLSRNGRALVAEVKALQPAMSGFRQGLQNRALKGTAEDLRALATIAIPQTRAGLNALADDWSDAFRQITLAVTDPSFTGSFNIAARGADWFFDQANSRIQPTVRSIMTLVRSADPLARAFGTGLINAIDKFNAKIASANASGSLDEFFADGADGAAAFMDLAQDVITITGQVLGAVQRQGGTLRDTAAALDAYIQSGRSAQDIAGIVDTLTGAYEGLRDVLGPLASIARDALADPGTAAAIRTMFDVLAAGSQVLRVIFDLFQGLPDSVQGFILAGIALGIMIKKVNVGLVAMQVAASRAATSLAATGVAGARAGRGMQTAAAGAGKLVGALVALQLAGMVLDQFDGAAADVEALNRSITAFAAKGELSGEITRLFGDDLDQLSKHVAGASDHWFPKLGRSIEGLLPPVKSLNEMIFGGSWTGSVERVEALDAALTQYAETTGDTAGSQKLWNELFNKSGLDMQEFAKLMPSSTAKLQEMQDAAHAGASGMQAQSERAKLLAGSFHAAALAGKDLATTMDLINGKNISAVEGQIALEEAYDKAKETVDEYGRVTKKGTHEINLGTEAGRASMAALIGIQQAATQAADAEVKRTGDTAAGIPILNAARNKFIALATTMTGSAAAAQELANQIFGIPDKDVNVDVKKEAAVAKLRDMGFEIKRLPNGKYVLIDAKTAEAKRKLAEAKAAIDRINGKTVTITVRTVRRNGDVHVSGPGGSGTLTREAKGGVVIPRQRGGATAAAAGLVQPQMRGPGTVYQWAEPETGGELFLPRRGINLERGRALLEIAATWYRGMFLPMRRGGVVAAAAGLVNVAPSSTSAARRATPLDSAEAYLRTRDAVTALSKALKDNGRSFSTATAKGRENRTALYSAIRAAQDAARTKFEETGSVRAANAAYDAHIRSLRATLQQQKVNAATVRQLLALAQRPTYDSPAAAPVNSSKNIAMARANIAANAGVVDLGDKLSLNRPGVDITTAHGRENLASILDFLGLAEAAAQARFEQTGSASKATTSYNFYLTALRNQLKQAGYAAATITSLINTYGKITLQRNDRGGVYMALGGIGMLGAADVYQRPMYGWAEKQTGGELFLPRLGDRARGERLLAMGAGWYGGRYTPGGASGQAGTTINNNLTVNGRMEPLTIGQLAGFMRQMDAEARVGRRR